MSVRTGLAAEFGVPQDFLCTAFEGDVLCPDNSEMVDPKWLDIREVINAVKNQDDTLFPPFADSVHVLYEIWEQGAEDISNEPVVQAQENEYNNENDGGPGSGRYPKGSGKANEPSAEGRNEPCTGFKNEAAAKRHEKHWKEFGFTSHEQYEKAAIEFLHQPVGGDIDGYLRAEDGAIIRFNTKTTEFAVGYPGGELLTYFKAKYDKKNGVARPGQANDYFNRKKKEEMVEDGKGPA